MGISSQGNRRVNILSAQQVENLVARQFPTAVRFSQDQRLIASLPDRLRTEHLSNQDPLLVAFVTVLGRNEVERFLTTHNPAERERLLTQMQVNIDTVAAEVNATARHANRPDMVDVRLASFEGLQVTVRTGGKFSYYKHLSDNTKMLFAYYLFLRARRVAGDVLLFDEPSNGFHAAAQEELLRFLKRLAQEGHLIVVSTHSEHLIDPDHLTGVRRMDVDADGNYLAVRNKWNAATQGKGDYLALRPVMDAIGLRYGASHLSVHDRVIVTEGPSELLYLRAFRELLRVESDLHIAPANGDEAIPHVVAFIISQGLHFKVVVDTRTHGKSAKMRLQEAFPIPSDSIFEIQLPANIVSSTSSGIEDIFSKADFARILTDMGHPPDPEFATMSNSHYLNTKQVGRASKLMVATWFREHVGDYAGRPLDEETLQNVRDLMEFCLNEAWYLL